jgi:hypothetical protein
VPVGVGGKLLADPRGQDLDLLGRLLSAATKARVTCPVALPCSPVAPGSGGEPGVQHLGLDASAVADAAQPGAQPWLLFERLGRVAVGDAAIRHGDRVTLPFSGPGACSGYAVDAGLLVTSESRAATVRRTRDR